MAVNGVEACAIIDYYLMFGYNGYTIIKPC